MTWLACQDVTIEKPFTTGLTNSDTPVRSDETVCATGDTPSEAVSNLNEEKENTDVIADKGPIAMEETNGLCAEAWASLKALIF